MVSSKSRKLTSNYISIWYVYAFCFFISKFNSAFLIMDVEATMYHCKIFVQIGNSTTHFFLYIASNPLRLRNGCFLWFKITDILLVSLNMKNYFLQKQIEISNQLINFYVTCNPNKYSIFWWVPVNNLERFLKKSLYGLLKIPH